MFKTLDKGLLITITFICLQILTIALLISSLLSVSSQNSSKMHTDVDNAAIDLHTFDYLYDELTARYMDSIFDITIDSLIQEIHRKGSLFTIDSSIESIRTFRPYEILRANIISTESGE